MNYNTKKVKNDIKSHLLYSNASWTDYMHRSVMLALLCILIWAFNLNMWGVLHSEHKKDWTFPNKALAALPPVTLPVILTETNEAVRKAPESRDTAPHPDNGKDGGLVGLINKTFGEHAERAVRIFNCESHLDPFRHSGVDITADGRPFSIGVAQINLSVTAVDGLNCPAAFSGQNFNATVVDEKLYNKCVKAAENPEINLKIAKQKFDARGNFGAWLYCANKNK